MKKPWTSLIILMIIAGVNFLSCSESSQQVLICSTAKIIPKMDGKMDDPWKLVRPLEIETVVPPHKAFAQSYYGKKYTVTLRSMHTDKDIYFFVQWTGDTSPSYERESWYYNDSLKKWMQKPKYEKDEFSAPAYEDKFSFLWEMNDSSPDFRKKGGSIFCFDNKKRTRSVSERMDMWHWKLDRTGPVEQLDDQYLTYYENDPNGRASDAGEASYKDNSQTVMKKEKEIKIPALWIPEASDYHWIMSQDPRYKKILSIDDQDNLIDEEGNILRKEDFLLNSKKLIPSVIYIKEASGSRGDVTTFDYYDMETKTWNLEIKRLLTNQNTNDDVQFDKKGKDYWFSVAVFDQSAIAHATPGGNTGTAFKMIIE